MSQKPLSGATDIPITRITVGGFKSISQEQSIEIKPLTILAGANSSGKSSIMQPLLLLKQTLESTYDPGQLLLNGPNVKFTSAKQLLSRTDDEKSAKSFHVGIAMSDGSAMTTTLTQNADKGLDDEDTLEPVRLIRGEQALEDSILRIIHLPGLRGSPERDYPLVAVGPTFPGTFEAYVASIIEQWQIDNESERLAKLNSDLVRLALTRKVVARRKNATAIELLVDRFLQGDKEEMVSIADVGFGVSHALPIIVALHTAAPGQLVYIEQPEIHLHPHAQSVMAEVLADAVILEKRLVVEPDSSLLSRGVQTLVAEGKLSPELVKLHWFKR